MAVYGGSPKVEPARELREGDEVGGFVVLDTPGHSTGHISFWRESDRTLVCGDVFFDMNILTTAPGLRQPPTLFNFDTRRTRRASAGWPSWNRQSRCSATGHRCATRPRCGRWSPASRPTERQYSAGKVGDGATRSHVEASEATAPPARRTPSTLPETRRAAGPVGAGIALQTGRS